MNTELRRIRREQSLTIPMNPSAQSLDGAISIPAVPAPATEPILSSEVTEVVARLGLAEPFPEVIELTREIFGNFHVAISEDPEIQDCWYVTFEVEVDGSVDEAVRKEADWAQRLPRWPTQARGAFCLGIRILP